MSCYDFLRSLILPLNQIDDFLPKAGKIIDLGCGQGVVTYFLARRRKRFLIGVDIDTKRLGKSKIRNVKFEAIDIRKFSLKGAKGIILSDVLHHLKPQDQKNLIARIAKEIDKSGTLIIKEIDAKELIRSRFSRLWDFILYPKDQIFYFNSHELIKFLKDLGFEVKMIRASRLFPGSTTLYICRKK